MDSSPGGGDNDGTSSEEESEEAEEEGEKEPAVDSKPVAMEEFGVFKKELREQMDKLEEDVKGAVDAVDQSKSTGLSLGEINSLFLRMQTQVEDLQQRLNSSHEAHMEQTKIVQSYVAALEERCQMLEVHNRDLKNNIITEVNAMKAWRLSNFTVVPPSAGDEDSKQPAVESNPKAEIIDDAAFAATLRVKEAAEEEEAKALAAAAAAPAAASKKQSTAVVPGAASAAVPSVAPSGASAAAPSGASSGASSGAPPDAAGQKRKGKQKKGKQKKRRGLACFPGA